MTPIYGRSGIRMGVVHRSKPHARSERGFLGVNHPYLWPLGRPHGDGPAKSAGTKRIATKPTWNEKNCDYSGKTDAGDRMGVVHPSKPPVRSDPGASWGEPPPFVAAWEVAWGWFTPRNPMLAASVRFQGMISQRRLPEVFQIVIALHVLQSSRGYTKR